MTKTKTKTNYLTVYKMSLAMALIKKGHSPVYTMPNPRNTKLVCWVFEKTEDFLADFEALVREVSA